MINVSLVLLTYNRAQTAMVSLRENLKSAGYPIYELIHVDNGSDDQLKISADIYIQNKKNEGVAKGYNRGMVLATGSHIAITGCDRIMPRGWLKAMVDAAEAIPKTGVISIYSPPRFGQLDHEGRMHAPSEIINGITIRRADACEARFHSRKFLLGAGFFREDFGLYGFEDCEWRDRAEVYARRQNLINYTLPSLGLAKHVDDGTDAYLKFKSSQVSDPAKAELVRKCHELGNPYYNPYL